MHGCMYRNVYFYNLYWNWNKMMKLTPLVLGHFLNNTTAARPFLNFPPPYPSLKTQPSSHSSHSSDQAWHFIESLRCVPDCSPDPPWTGRNPDSWRRSVCPAPTPRCSGSPGSPPAGSSGPSGTRPCPAPESRSRRCPRCRRGRRRCPLRRSCSQKQWVNSQHMSMIIMLLLFIIIISRVTR